MAAPVWRYLLTIVALFSLAVAFTDLFDSGRFANIGFTYDTVSETQAVVREVFPESAAQRAGVKAGDRVDAPWFRYEHTLGPGLAGLARAGAPLSFYDERLRRHITIVTKPISNIFSSSRIGAHALRIFGFLLALGLFWSRPVDRAARAFAAFLIVYGLETFGNTGTSILGLDFGYVTGTLLVPFIPYTLVLFCCWFPDRYPKDGRRTISIVATAFAGLFAVVTLCSMVYGKFGVGPHLPGNLFFDLANYVEEAVFALLTIAALIIDFRRSAQLDRLRLEWLTLGMAFIMYSYTSLSWFPGLFTSAGGAFNDLGDWLSNVGEVVGILCILYAFLRYRVLDLTFAINRAAVFGVVSTTIVALFVLVEYLVSRYVESYSHLSGTIITLGSALAIGVGMRSLHRRVDGFADRLIFRARYEAETALRAFGRRAAFITDEQTLQERTVWALTEYGWAEHAALYLARTDGDFALGAGRPEKPLAQRISAHDPTVLALKDSRNAQLVHSATSRVQAELVFPMIARGELIGFAACGKRRIRETYTPDEMEAMNFALEHVAVQLDVILMQRLQVQLREVQELVRAYALLGAEASRVLAGIASVSGIGDEETKTTPA